MVHEFNTPEGQARLSRALEADYEMAQERHEEQLKLEKNELQPWFDSLSESQKEQLGNWALENDEALIIGLIHIVADYHNEQDRSDL